MLRWMSQEGSTVWVGYQGPNPESTDGTPRVHQSIPQRPLDTNTILEISLVLTESDQGSSQSQLRELPYA